VEPEVYLERRRRRKGWKEEEGGRELHDASDVAGLGRNMRNWLLGALIGTKGQKRQNESD